jgi:hypothetical protein
MRARISPTRRWLVAAVTLTIALLEGGAVAAGQLPRAAAGEECVWPYIGPGCPWHDPDPRDFPFNDPGLPSTNPGGGGGGAAPPNSAEVKNVLKKVEKALDDKACNDFVSGKQPKDNDARSTLKTDTFVERPKKRDPQDPTTFASTAPESYGRGSGRIYLWLPFFTPSILLGNRDKSKAYRPIYNLIKDYSVAQLQALLLLHELGHVQGSVPADHEGSWGSVPNPEIAYMTKLASVCKPPQ